VNTRTVDPRTTWAVVMMEAAVALPLMSLATQGDRLPGLAGPLLLLLLLPAGCLAVMRVAALREPSSRLLAGIGLALATRALVEAVPQANPAGLLVWLAHSVVPAAIGIGLWWRGGALAVAELTPSDVRTEFSVVAVCLLATLAFLRPFLLADPALLESAVGLFAVGGLIGAALSRQDAADVPVGRSGRGLALGTSLAPALLAVILVGALRPDLLSGMWLLLARLIELALTPIGWLVAWLSSLFPHGAPQPLPTPQPLPRPPAPDPATIADVQQRMAWVGTLIVVTLLAAAGGAALLAARLLLGNFIRDPNTLLMPLPDGEDLVVESTGSPRGEAAHLFGWLARWLHARMGRRGARLDASSRVTVEASDAWAAYQQLLRWADDHDVSRRPSETTGQVHARLADHVPEAASSIALVTDTFERERYGGLATSGECLRRVREALARLSPR
jgi:hypothetical protein